MTGRHVMTDARESMARVSNTQRARQVIAILRGRLSDIEYIGWPRLEASLRRELTECEQIARDRGLIA